MNSLCTPTRLKYFKKILNNLCRSSILVQPTSAARHLICEEVSLLPIFLLCGKHRMPLLILIPLPNSSRTCSSFSTRTLLIGPVSQPHWQSNSFLLKWSVSCPALSIFFSPSILYMNAFGILLCFLCSLDKCFLRSLISISSFFRTFLNSNFIPVT